MAFRLNLKIKFTLTICCLLAVTTVSLGWIFLLQVEKSALRVLREKGEIFAEGLARGAELGVLTHNVDLLDLAVRRLREESDVVYAGVADERGTILVEHRAEGEAGAPDWAGPAGRMDASTSLSPELLADPPAWNGPTVYYVRAPIQVDREGSIGADVGVLIGEEGASPLPGLAGTACVGISTAGVMKEMQGLRRGLVLATLAVLIAGVAIAVLLVRVIVEPIKRLVHASERIAAGDLDVLLPHRGQDEIGALSDSFNKMTFTLSESRQALERSNAELEKKVQERTKALKEAQNQLIQAEKMSVVGQLVSGVAHELNNPLAGVLGYTQLLLRRHLAPEAERGLLKIEAEAERCKKIVQNLLIFARKHKPRKSLLDLNAVVESTLELRSYHLKVDNIHVERDLDPHLPRTMADMNQMQQVLMNIINNAHHAMLNVDRQRALTIRTRHVEGTIRIQVTDTGSGIEQDHLTRIFDPFFTTKEVGRGTGLGLSICYGIIQQHRGEIRVESALSRGTTFTIELPVQSDGVQETSDAAVIQELLGSSAARKGRVLLVDDEVSILEVIGDILRIDGHEVETTTNGAAALAKLRQQSFDVIVSDMKMPGMSGQELFAHLSEIDPKLVRRLIFTTGDLASPETLSFLERVGNTYLQKPFDLNAVRRTIQAMLTRV